MIIHSTNLLGEPPSRMDSRMIFSPGRGLLYVSVPKTGCTTIKTVVAASVGFVEPRVLSRNADGSIHRALLGRGELWSGLTDAERGELLFDETVFRFTSVRNPYERLVSCYLDKLVEGRPKYYLRDLLLQRGEVTMLSFLRFVADQPPLDRDVHCRAMVDLCYAGHINYNEIIRYETFEDDLRRVMDSLQAVGWPIPKPWPVQRTFAGSHISEILGREERALIRRIYGRDFDAFGYSRALADVGRR
jgi:hypothetical protein